MQIVPISQSNLSQTAEKAAAALLRGNVLVCPTDTVYGLLADATSKQAVKKVFLIKGRKQGKPLPIFVKDIAMAKKLAKVSPFTERYMRKVWPGKVTLVMESRGILPRETGTEERIGLRIPKHVFVQQLLEKLHRPLTGTSANLAGKAPLSDSGDVIRMFQQRRYKPDVVIDAGKLLRSRPSLVLDITGKSAKVVRK